MHSLTSAFGLLLSVPFNTFESRHRRHRVGTNARGIADALCIIIVVLLLLAFHFHIAFRASKSNFPCEDGACGREEQLKMCRSRLRRRPCHQHSCLAQIMLDGRHRDG